MPDRRRATAVVDPLTASAKVFTAAQQASSQVFQYQSWQEEAWAYWRSLGEFNQGITWLANAISRVRLNAAEMVPGGDEPEPLTEGPAAELMEQFAGGIAGQAAFLKAMAFQVGVPGEGWLVAERDDPSIPLAAAKWCVYSTDAIRPRKGSLQVRVDETRWRTLAVDNLAVRVWEPDPQYPWRATSSAEPAIPIMRRIDLLDRRIVAMLVSRLAMNGLLLIPQEGTIATPAQFADAPDPFVAMVIDIASKNIANPGQASAAIPLPIKFPSEFIEKWKHLAFGDAMDEQLLLERDKELFRLATTLNISTERLSGGMGEVNHWGAWQLEEGEIKTSICPPVETVCDGLTKGFLQPMLLEAGADPLGPNGGKLLVWYDTSELTARPDKSTAAKDLYDRIEIGGTALRRESGFDESDAPEPKEIASMVWKKLAGTVELGPTAAGELSGLPQPEVPVAGAPSGPGNGSASDGEGSAPATGAPSTRENSPPAPGTDATLARVLRTATSVLAGQRDTERRLEQLVVAAESSNGHNGNGKRPNGYSPQHRRR